MDPSLGAQVRKAGYCTTLAFILLSARLAYWQIHQSNWLLHQPYNRHLNLLEDRIKRGGIYDANGSPLAVSHAGGPGHRSYPQGPLCSQFLGYLSPRYGRTGLEGAYDAELSGMGSEPGPLSPNPLLTGQRKQGSSVYLTLDLKTQKAASAALGIRTGAVVALDPTTGRILALVSYPSYNPTDVTDHWDSLSQDRHRPLFNRALQGLYQPGSTFKVLTASAAIDTDTAAPSDQFNCSGQIHIGRYTIHEMGHEVHGDVDLGMALAQSCNITFAQVGLRLGAAKMYEYAHRFWVDQPLDFVLPTATGQVTTREHPGDEPSQEKASGGKGHSHPAKSSVPSLLKVPTILAQTAFGQGKVAITPLEDAMIASTVANHGVLMKPYLVDRVVDTASGIGKKTQPSILSQPISSATAAAVTTMMKLAFTAGTARRLQVPGLSMAGKTGTAENPHGRTHAWFVGFAPADHPRVVVACIVENGGVGGVQAGPVVRSTILAALRYHPPAMDGG